MSSSQLSETDLELVGIAGELRARAYAPFSNYRVGAAIRDEHGNVHVGCNVENSAFPSGACAESGAIGAMIAAGGRKIAAIATIGGHDAPEACTPCGNCRQQINEFADADTRVLLIGDDGEVIVYGIDALLPGSFRLG